MSPDSAILAASVLAGAPCQVLAKQSLLRPPWHPNPARVGWDQEDWRNSVETKFTRMLTHRHDLACPGTAPETRTRYALAYALLENATRLLSQNTETAE